MEDYAYGCIIGAFCGDTCGSFVQFSQTIVDEETMDKCMKLPGGGPLKNGEGQVTDDGELGICLMGGIIIGNIL